MIIWGSRGVKSTLEQSEFHCPNCDMVRPGTLKQVRNFFTLYFIPVIPLNVAGRYVECQSCGGSYGEEILKYKPEDERKENQTRMLRVMVMAAMADEFVDENEKSEIKRQYQLFTGLPLTNQMLDEEIQTANGSNADLNSYVALFADGLSGHGKALIVKLAFHTMSASGELQPGHQQQLSKLAQTLEIPQDQYMALIDALSNPDAP